MFKDIYESGFVLALLLVGLHYVVYFHDATSLLMIASGVFVSMVIVMLAGTKKQNLIIEKIWYPWGTLDKSMLGVFIGSMLLSVFLLLEYLIVSFIK